METLPLHIEYLLTRHDCVIVPGIGAFIATETDSYVDFERGVIVPRRREISFNGSVVTDDGLLAHSVARRERLSYEDAHRLVASFTEKMRADLRGEGEISVGRIGRLVMDAEGLVAFQPRRSKIREDLFGELRLQPAKAAEVAERPAADVAAVKAPGTRTVLVAADRYVFTVSKRAVHAAAMLIMILTVAVSLIVPINHDNQQKASVISFDEFFNRSSQPVENPATVAAEDTVADNSGKKITLVD